MRWSPVLVALLGCRGKGEDQPEGGGSPAESAPDIAVDAAVDLGALPVGDVATATLVVTNEGAGDLRITSARIVGDERLVYSLSAPGSATIAPGETASLIVSYAPVADGADDALLVIESDDPDEPEARVALAGAGLAPELAIDPGALDLGEVSLGCAREEPIALANAGSLDLVIDGLSFASDADSLSFDADFEANGPLPWTLAPGESRLVSVAYAPDVEAAAAATLTVTSNDPLQPSAIATQAGLGAIADWQVDAFSLDDPEPAVFLFGVDSSASMDNDVATLVSSIASLASALDDLGVEYRIAAIIRDDGEICGDVTYIDSAGTAADLLAGMLALDFDCQAGSSSERTFLLLEAGLDANAGWTTDEPGWEQSTLNLVGFSDEAEQSPGTWESYVLEFAAWRADPADVIVHGIGGGSSSCIGVEPYAGFHEAVEATGGVFLDICGAAWGPRLPELAGPLAARLSTFALSEVPITSTLSVSVDGAPAVGWSYDPVTNAVIFEEGAYPAPGADVSVAYGVRGECGG